MQAQSKEELRAELAKLRTWKRTARRFIARAHHQVDEKLQAVGLSLLGVDKQGRRT